MLNTVKSFKLENYFNIGNSRFVFIGGPCSIENEDMCFQTAETLIFVCSKLKINYIFKGSFDKANRSSLKCGRAVGMEAGLKILEKIKNKLKIPVTTDVHETWQCEPVGNIVDVIQIPAYLCRQTDLIISAAKTGKAVNVKKGQFMAPRNMDNVIHKILSTDNEKIILCERGTTFGYNYLVVDMTGLIEMRKLGFPVFFDATHSVQKPGSNGILTSGNREYIPYLINAALAVGVDGIFAEVHPDPDNAVSDGPSQIKLTNIEQILTNAIEYDNITKGVL